MSCFRQLRNNRNKSSSFIISIIIKRFSCFVKRRIILVWLRSQAVWELSRVQHKPAGVVCGSWDVGRYWVWVERYWAGAELWTLDRGGRNLGPDQDLSDTPLISPDSSVHQSYCEHHLANTYRQTTDTAYTPSLSLNRLCLWYNQDACKINHVSGLPKSQTDQHSTQLNTKLKN